MKNKSLENWLKVKKEHTFCIDNEIIYGYVVDCSINSWWNTDNPISYQECQETIKGMVENCEEFGYTKDQMRNALNITPCIQTLGWIDYGNDKRKLKRISNRTRKGVYQQLVMSHYKITNYWKNA